MSEAKKYTMRPARRLPGKDGKEGRLVAVSVGGGKYLTGEGEYAVNAQMHVAWTRGDIEIDDYPPKPVKKKADKKKAKKAKPVESATTEDQS